MAHDVFGIVGTTIAGAFKVEAVVAEGGFAVVYRAHHAGFRAPVALKCLKIPQYLSEEERVRFEGQFQAEAELLFKLSASIPVVVRPLHVEAIVAPDGSFMPFLALEWLDGETLDAVAKRRSLEGRPPFTLDELIALLTPVARALERAHHFVGPEGPISIVHRDMKPENVFVARVAGESVVKILDFGIATAKSMASQVAGRASQSGGSVASFTPAYGAPEQWLPKRFGQTGPWTDVWGFALTMVELLAGRAVVDGDQAGMMGTVLDPGRRPTPRTEGVPVSDAVEAVFLRALAVDPRERYRDAGELWNALVAAQAADARRPVGRSNTSGALIPDLEPRRAPGAVPELELSPPASRSNPSARSGQFSAAARSVSKVSPAEPPAFFPTEADIPTEMRPAAVAPRPAETSGPRGAVSGVPKAPHSIPSPARPASFDYSQFTNLESSSGTLRELVQRFGVPAGMVAGGLLLSVADGAYATAHGEVFTLGPLRLAWLVAVLVLSGIGLALYRFFGGAPQGRAKR